MLERRAISYQQLAHTEHVEEILPGGEILYKKGEQEVLLTPAGLAHRRAGKDVSSLLNDKHLSILSRRKTIYQGARLGYVTQERIGKCGNQLTVAFKRVMQEHPNPEYWDLTGVDQCMALRGLQGVEGVFCAVPLAATETRLITQWVDKPLATTTREAQQALPEYLDALDTVVVGLKEQGLWKENWQVERQPANYAIEDLAHPDVLRRFIAIDPAYIYSKIVF